MKKDAFEIITDGREIKITDENGRVLKTLDFADVIFSACEAAGFDCNGCGLTIKNVR